MIERHHPRKYDGSKVQWSIAYVPPEDIEDALTEGWEPFAITHNHWLMRRRFLGDEG